MKLIKPSFEIIPFDPNPLIHIERIARTCYKSEDKITDESAPTFVKMLFNKGHHAMLEFYPFYFRCNTGFTHALMMINQSPDVNGDLMAYDDFKEPWSQVSCSLRTAMMISKYSGQLSGAIIKQYPELAYMFNKITTITDNDTMACKLVDLHSINPNLQYATVRFITDRGITHELVRHRKCSFAQESTRYVNYGGKDMQFIIPSFITESIDPKLLTTRIHDQTASPEESCQLTWYNMCETAEEEYNELLKHNWLPQQARSILPNSLKTEIVVQARLSEWKHIFRLRCNNAAHPDMRAIMIPLREEMSKRYPEYDFFTYE